MDRQIIYAGAIPLDTDQLSQTRNTHIALGRMLDGLYGSGAVTAGGFACTPGSGLQVNVAPGMVCVPFQEDPTAFGSLPPDTNPMVRQYLSQAPLTFSAPAGATTYIWAVCSSADNGKLVLPFYNAANPSQTFAGQGNSGGQLPTVRQDIAAVAAGSSVPQNGVLLWTVVVPSGATSISASMLMKSGVIQPTIPQLAPKDSPAFTTQGQFTFGGGSMVANFQTDGNFVVGQAPNSGNGNKVVPSLTANSSTVNAYQPFFVYSNINAKYDYVGNGAIGIGGSISTGGPASNNFQWTGNDTSGYNPIYSHTNGFFQAIGGIYSYSTSAACAYFGTSVTGPVVNFYGTGGVAGTISINSSGGVSFNTTSDYRLKSEVQPITAAEAWGRLKKLNPVSFERTDAVVKQRITGHLAHEFGAVYAWGLTGEKDATVTNDRGETVIVPQQIDTSSDEPDLVVALLDALARIESLEAEIATMKKGA